MPAQELAGHGGPVRALAVLPGEGASGGLASSGFDQAVILWDPAQAGARRVMRWHGGAVNALAALPDGGLASAGEDGRIALWPPGGAEQPRQVLEGHAAPVAALAVGPGGELASAGWDGTVRRWRPDGTAAVLEGHRGPVNGLAFLPAGLASAGYDGSLRLWAADGSGRVIGEFGVPQNALAALPQGEAFGGLAAAGADGMVRLLGPDGTVRVLPVGPRPVVALAVAPPRAGHGGLLAAASLGGSVSLLALPEGRLVTRLEGPGLPVWAVAFAADGQSLWTGGQDRVVRRWSLAGQPLGPLQPAVPAAAAGGEDAWAFRACVACHALRAEAGPMAGPHLQGLFGRRMGSVPGYPYSERLARGDITWTRETVAELFTRGPDVVTPGTRMPVQRLENPAEMAALLHFLEEATR
ncbi:c-type cytochrome [Siccirubricoccus phaeus]|uniref:c-type cytochrome n=1 Tax=Siccirubricoccus phaeus TaxID=2595053 RepID=UPI001F15C023|nr:c-type cytochrome [Siccirubricoccus phaeus]